MRDTRRDCTSSLSDIRSRNEYSWRARLLPSRETKTSSCFSPGSPRAGGGQDLADYAAGR